jgi:hypothetical protein
MNSYTVGKHCDTLFILKYQYQARRVMMRVCLCDLYIGIDSGSTISLFDFGPVPTGNRSFFQFQQIGTPPPKKYQQHQQKIKAKQKIKTKHVS